MDPNSFTILGAGNGGRAFAAYLAQKGFKVHLGYRIIQEELLSPGMIVVMNRLIFMPKE